MFFQCLDKDQNIIQIYYNNTFYYKALKNIVHYSLEHREAVGYTKEYYQRFKKSIFCIKYCLLLITRLNTNIVEFPVDI